MPYTVYPNPVVSNTLFIKGSQLDRVQLLSVIDLSGKLIQKEDLPFKNKNSVNVQHLKPGVYLLKIDNYSLKFIKK